jgi:glycosyltransferase involved in cell wall biosynthesis
MKILPVSDSPWAPTGFGTNTKNIAAIFAEAGHKVGYGGCQNPQHDPNYEVEWPLGSDKKQKMELLPLMYPGDEKFGEKSFPEWIGKFKPDLVFTHLDIQMFSYMMQVKKPMGLQLPTVDPKGNPLTPALIARHAKKALKLAQKPRFKVGSIIPIDGQPSIPAWQMTLKEVDYPVAMSEYGKTVMKLDFPELGNSWHKKVQTIPHGVDTDFFKPRLTNKPDAFIVGCVARNQHRKNIPRLLRAFKIFVERNNLTPNDAKLMLHMNWEDHMGWNIEYMTSPHIYNIREYLMDPTMGNLEMGQHPDENGMVEIFNMMDVHALPTGGEGFGIPTLESMSCGRPNIICNYTTSYELVGADKPECPEDMVMPHGWDGDDNLIETDRGFLVPYKDMMWDTPIRAAPRRALWDEHKAADALEYYYHNRDACRAHGKNARKYAIKHYDWNRVIGPTWKKWVEGIK